MATTPAIEAQHLGYAARKHFYGRRQKRLDAVTFRVMVGEIFGFLGPNGAGKTTLIKLMLNLLTPTSGQVLLHGRPATAPEARRCVGFVPERALYPPDLSAREFVFAHALWAGLSPATARRRSAVALEQLDLAHAAKRRLRVFSKGMLQRVGLAQALVGDPDILVLDEPMSGLDPPGRRDVRHLMQRLRAAGKTIFFSTHILPDVELVCDRVGILAAGRMRHMGTLAELYALGPRHVEVHTEGLSPAGVAAARAVGGQMRLHAGGHAFEVDSLIAANHLIDCVRVAGGVVCSVQASSSLEPLFDGEAAP